MLRKDWNSSLELLQILQTELLSASGSAVAKLSRLISWEMLLVQISKLLEEWPAPHLGKDLSFKVQARLDSPKPL